MHVFYSSDLSGSGLSVRYDNRLENVAPGEREHTRTRLKTKDVVTYKDPTSVFLKSIPITKMYKCDSCSGSAYCLLTVPPGLLLDSVFNPCVI